ncbi:MAG: HipA domain-containing protein, partial [Janthinobacterium lividum]
APKYLLTLDHQGRWHADATLDDTQAAQHFIVKLPRGQQTEDRTLLRNEAAYMEVAREMGLRVGGQVVHRDGMLFIPRFDRLVGNGKVIRLHQESAASIAGVAGFNRRPSQFELLFAIRGVVSDPARETLEYLQRDVLNLAMRNTDNHARNTALQIIGSTVQLTPLFDFAPMYMDPEGISRAARWYDPQAGHEIGNWADVLTALALPRHEDHALRLALTAFGQRLEELPEIMRRCQVDDAIIDHLHYPMATQRAQLKEL